MSDQRIVSPDPQVAELVQSSATTLRAAERSLAELRVMEGDWTPALRQSLERLALAFSGVMEAVEDPRFPVFFDAASAVQFSQQANAVEGFFIRYPNDAPNIVPGVWQHVAALAAILHGSFIGRLRGRPASDELAVEAAVGRVQRLAAEFREAENQLKELSERQLGISQEAAALMATTNKQFLEQQRALEREWREALKVERDAVAEERDAVRAEVETLRSQNKALHEAFTAERVAALAALEAAKNGAVERLADYERQAREALGAVGSTAQSASYQVTADSAGQRRTRWQAGAVGGMAVAAIALLVFVVADPVAVDLSAAAIVGMVKRALFVGFLGILSRYCAAMADGARREQLWAHQRAVELRALGPYLEPLPDSERLKMRERLADKYFGVGSTLLVEAASQGLPATGTHDVVGALLKLLAEKVPSESVLQAVLNKKADSRRDG